MKEHKKAEKTLDTREFANSNGSKSYNEPTSTTVGGITLSSNNHTFTKQDFENALRKIARPLTKDEQEK